MADILRYDDIPLENLLLRVLYSIAFVYRRHGNRIPLMREDTNFTHDETRGCIFDMDGIKTDIIFSTNKPQLCAGCIANMTNSPNNRIEKNLIESVQKELKTIDKNLYYQIADFIKENPKMALLISSTFALLIGTIGSLIATAIWEKIKKS